MTIILANEQEVNPILVQGEKQYLFGQTRDVLSFVFPVDTSLDELDATFTEDNCATIKIMEGDNEYIHSGYTLRANLKREPIEITPATPDNEAVVEQRVIVSMAQRTYSETKMIELEKKMAKLAAMMGED